MGAMSGNLHRLTASRILLVFAVALFVVSLLALQIRLKRDQLEWVEYPTALGDTDFYDPAGAIGANDFYEPNLRFAERPDGIFRRNHKPQERRDEHMFSAGQDATGSYTIYTPRDREANRLRPVEGKNRRYFLKVGEDRYVEFGERKYWPDFDPDAAARSGASDNSG